MRVIVTRARADAERTAAALRARGHEALLSPVLEIVGTGAMIDQGKAQAVIATSAHAFETLSPDGAAKLKALPLFVVGERTAEAAVRIGLQAPRLTAARASELASRMTPLLPAGSHLLYLAGHDRKPDLEDALQHEGLVVNPIVVYEARAVEALSQEVTSALMRNEAKAVFHYSRRSTRLFLDSARLAGLGEQASRLRHICISADAAAEVGAGALIARTPDSAGLLGALEQM